MANIKPNEDFQKKIDSAFPADGIIYFPKPGDEKFMEIMTTGRAFALAILKNIPHSRERSLAFTRLQECLVWIILGLLR